MRKGQTKLLMSTSEGEGECPNPSLSKEIIYFLIGYYNKAKECLKVVKTLLDPLP